MKTRQQANKTKAAKTRKSSKPRLALIDQQLLRRRTIRFPKMKGRVVESIEFFTMERHHDLTILFRDRTALYLEIDPGYNLQAVLETRAGGQTEVVHAWPIISLEA